MAVLETLAAWNKAHAAEAKKKATRAKAIAKNRL